MTEISIYVTEILNHFNAPIVAGIGMMLAFGFANRIIDLFKDR